MTPGFFTSPQQAVEAAGRLLATRDWAALSRYYDLSGTAVALSELESGAFFIGADEGTPSHPAWPRGPLRPFPPGFRYDSHREDGNDAVVTVTISIDQGDGMVQRGIARFRLRRHSDGWKVRPEAAD